MVAIGFFVAAGVCLLVAAYFFLRYWFQNHDRNDNDRIVLSFCWFCIAVVMAAVGVVLILR